MNNGKDRYATDEDEYCLDENKFSRTNLRQDTELFDEDECVVHDLVGVRWVPLSKGEDWEITKNRRNVLVLKGVRFSKKERDFLRTAAGMSFIVGGYKQGWKSISEFKRQVKKCLKR
jgi:hypothetical protein